MAEDQGELDNLATDIPRDPQLERAKTSADEVEGDEFVGTDAADPTYGWADPPEGHTEPTTNRDDLRRREG